MQLVAQRLAVGPASSSLSLPARRNASRRTLCVTARKNESNFNVAVVDKIKTAPLVAALAAAMVLGAATPDDAWAARSGGRVGGSVRSAPSRAAPAQQSRTTVINNTTVVAAPPVSPFGFGGFGFGGFYPSFFVPIGFGFGGFFQIFLVMGLLSVVAGVVSNMGNKNKDTY